MSRKAFQISIDFDVHAVSCPGVWLCQNGDVMLRIEMLGILKHTKRVEPTFPLLFHEQFSFRKAFPSIGTLRDLQDELKKRSIHLDLTQWCIDGLKTIVLASFKGSLSDVLYPSPLDKSLMAGVDVDLLMETTKCFPGIIAPKVEISTRVVIEEMTNYPASGYNRLLNPVTISSKKLSKKASESLILPKSAEEKKTYDNREIQTQKKIQKPVCHAKQKNRCYCSKKSSIKQEEKNKKLTNKDLNRTEDKEYNKYMKHCVCRQHRTIKSKDVISPKKENITYGFDESTGRSSIQSRDKSKECCCPCEVCHKYEDYFKSFYNKSENQSLAHRDCCLEFSSHKKRPLSDYAVSLKSGENECPCTCWRGTHNGQRSYKKKELHKPVEASRRYQSSVDANRLFSYSDLESYYHKLYERVCKNNNLEETHM